MEKEKMRILLVTLILLLGCAENKKQDLPPDPTIFAPPAPTIANIPYLCVAHTLNNQIVIGAHEFPDGQIRLVTAFDCGQREGKRCFYYLHITATSQVIDDVRCN